MSFANSQQRQFDLFSHCVLSAIPTREGSRRIANRRQGGLPDSVFEKNYRLQDIQLSKNPLAASGYGLQATGPNSPAFKLTQPARTRAGLPIHLRAPRYGGQVVLACQPVHLRRFAATVDNLRVACQP
jgi:hypothetical protein